MMTREEIEELDWTEEGGDQPAIVDASGEIVAVLGRDRSMREAGPLLAAAPELALACLGARDFAEGIRDLDWTVAVEGDAEDLIRALDAALALAGVKP